MEIWWVACLVKKFLRKIRDRCVSFDVLLYVAISCEMWDKFYFFRSIKIVHRIDKESIYLNRISIKFPFSKFMKIGKKAVSRRNFQTTERNVYMSIESTFFFFLSYFISLSRMQLRFSIAIDFIRNGDKKCHFLRFSYRHSSWKGNGEIRVSFEELFPFVGKKWKRKNNISRLIAR